MTDDATLRTLLAAAIHDPGDNGTLGACQHYTLAAGTDIVPCRQKADAILATPSGRALLDRAEQAERCAACHHGHDECAWSSDDLNDGTCWDASGPLVCGCPKFITEAVHRIRAALQQPTHPEAGG